MSNPSHERSRPPIALLSDFGYRDHYVGVMKGVIAAIAPSARLIDLTHGIPPQAVAAGAIALEQSWRYFPARTIFVAVVDPGVGTDRKAIAVECVGGTRFIGPDNGLLSMAAGQAGVRRIVELRSPRYRLPAVSATFHGRDIFAPAAAHLWRGARFAALGPKLASMVPVEAAPQAIEQMNKITGSVVYSDGFGNLITNIDRACVERLAGRFRGQRLSVRIGRQPPIEICDFYGEAESGGSLATFGSFERLEIAVRDGSAAQRYAAERGMTVTIRAVERSTDG